METQSQCASSVDPEDAVQESLLLIYQRIGALRKIAAFPAWTFSIVRRECYRLLTARPSRAASIAAARCCRST